MFEVDEKSSISEEASAGVEAVPASAVHGSLQDQIDTLSANLQSEMVARQALESRIAALESRLQNASV